MAQENRKTEPSPGEPSREREAPESERSRYGDHPFLGDDRQHLARETIRELLQFPERPQVDPIIPLPADPAREAVRHAAEGQPHDPSVDYQPPNSALIAPVPNLSMRLLGAAAAVVLFLFLTWLMFYNWMSPSPRQPGQQKQSPGLLQKIP